jgi:hypothetical protein
MPDTPPTPEDMTQLQERLEKLEARLSALAARPRTLTGPDMTVAGVALLVIGLFYYFEHVVHAQQTAPDCSAKTSAENTQALKTLTEQVDKLAGVASWQPSGCDEHALVELLSVLVEQTRTAQAPRCTPTPACERSKAATTGDCGQGGKTKTGEQTAQASAPSAP